MFDAIIKTIAKRDEMSREWLKKFTRLHVDIGFTSLSFDKIPLDILGMSEDDAAHFYRGQGFRVEHSWWGGKSVVYFEPNPEKEKASGSKHGKAVPDRKRRSSRRARASTPNDPNPRPAGSRTARDRNDRQREKEVRKTHLAKQAQARLAEETIESIAAQQPQVIDDDFGQE